LIVIPTLIGLELKFIVNSFKLVLLDEDFILSSKFWIKDSIILNITFKDEWFKESRLSLKKV